MYLAPTGIYAYELTDHLGNVRAVIAATGSVQTATDYYPFGMAIATLGTTYRFGYQGQNSEADPETNWNSFQLRMYSPRTARWMVMDPKGQFYSPYLAMGNNPVSGVDPDGGGDEDVSSLNNFFRNLANGSIFWSDDNARYDLQAWLYEDLGPSYTDNGITYTGSPGGNGSGNIKTTTYQPVGSPPPLPPLPPPAPATADNDAAPQHGWFYNVWNSTAVRLQTGDVFTVGAGYGWIFGIGKGASIEANWILHGPNASLWPIVTTTGADGVGFSGDATINAGKSFYTGSVENIDRSIVVTDTKGNGDPPTNWVGAGITEEGKIGVTVSWTKVPAGGYLIGYQVNVGVGIPAGPVPANLAGGVSNSLMLYDMKPQ